MNRYYENSFWKDIKKIIDHTLMEKIEQTILSIQKADSIKDIPRLKKMKGYKIHYRIKIGNYRIGIKIENETVTFIAFGHRKDIYKFFP